MTSLYSKEDNSFHEQPEMAKPDSFPTLSERFKNNAEWDEYNRLLEKCRIIPCSTPHSWVDGKEYVEGKDYKIDDGSFSTIYINDEDDTEVTKNGKWLLVVPLTQSNDEDELWKEVREECIEWHKGNQDLRELKFKLAKFHITKK